MIISTIIKEDAAAEIVCACSENNRVCFIQMGDEGVAAKGIIERLHHSGYFASSRVGEYNRTVYEAVCRFQEDSGFEPTGMMDDLTLTYLLWKETDSKINDADAAEVWVPTDGGKKRHAKQTCSGMYDRRKMSVKNARELGLDACQRCNPQ